MLNHVLKRDGHWSGLFVVGLVLAGLLQLRYATIPWSPELHLESPFWALLGGILVSLGTKLSGGCTSGHGICGLSRV